MPKTAVIAIASVLGVGAIVGVVLAGPALGDSLFGASTAQTSATGSGPGAAEFPVNENGETYGSAIGSSVPDLLAAPTDDGTLGYVRVSELELARNVAGSVESGERVVDVYASDGTTVIGQFTVTEDMPGPRAGMDDED